MKMYSEGPDSENVDEKVFMGLHCPWPKDIFSSGRLICEQQNSRSNKMFGYI